MTLFDELGGEVILRAIIDQFVDRSFDDMLIGFFFASANRERVKEKEYELAASHLGADVVYTGQPIAEAHAKHRIMGGQFMRRLQILREVLAAFEVQEHIVNHWVEHTERLRPLVTKDSQGECVQNSDTGANRSSVEDKDPEK